MSAHCLYPGEFFILSRSRPTANWEILYRDDSRPTMDARFSYQRERLKPGQGLRYETPKGEVIEEVEA